MSAVVHPLPPDRLARLLHLVPALPPPFDGVGSYAQALGGALAERFRRASAYLVCDPGWRPAAETGNAVAFPLPAREAGALGRLLEREAEGGPVLLHYANYGYDPHGCPDWLIAGLEGWRRGSPRRRLVTFFHEVYASGPPWRRSFWQQPRQRRLAARLARRSDAVATSLELYRDLLSPWRAGSGIEVLPVPSTLGEPARRELLAARRPRLVIFGGAGTRARSYGPYLGDLAATVRGFGIEEICDAGPPVELPARVAGVAVQACGVLAPSEIRDLLGTSKVGFMAYPPDFLPKSTVFAAYASCGVLPVCAWRGRGRRAPGRDTSPRYWPAGALAASPAESAAVAAAASAWYDGHAPARQAEVFERLLQDRADP